MEKRSLNQKVAVLSISLFLTTFTTLSVAVNQLQDKFPKMNDTLVQSLVTAPSIAVVVFTLMSSMFIKFLGKRKTITIGMILIILGGVIPGITSSFNVTYIGRLIIGAGVGLTNPLAVSIINDLFTGDQRSNMIGFQNAMQTIGSAFFSIMNGILLAFNVNYIFYLYLLGCPVLIYFLISTKGISELDDKHNRRDIQQEENTKTKGKLNVKSIGILLFLFAQLVVAGSMFTKIAPLTLEKGIFDSTSLGLGLTLVSVLGFISSLLYGKMMTYLGKWITVIGSILLSCSFIIVYFSTSMVQVTVALGLFGFSASMFIPWVFDTLMKVTDKDNVPMVISLAIVVSNLGQFVSPYLLKGYSFLTGDDSAKSSFVLCIWLLILMTVIVTFFIMKQQVNSFSLFNRKMRIDPEKFSYHVLETKKYDESNTERLAKEKLLDYLTAYYLVQEFNQLENKKHKRTVDSKMYNEFVRKVSELNII